MTTSKSGIPVNFQVTTPTAVVVNAKKLSELRAELASLREQFARLQDMEYAVEAGNTGREDVPADMLKAWFRYVHTGEREDDEGDGDQSELATLRERVAALEAFHEAARELNIMGLIPDLDQRENAEGEPIAVLVKWYIDTFRMAGGE